MAYINPLDVTHPEDQVALDNLQSMPLFTSATKAFMKAVPEDALAGLNMVQKIRLGPNQLPRVYALLPPICQKLGVAEPEFYLEMNPYPNAYTYGDTRVFITITSGLLQYLNEEEVRATITGAFKPVTAIMGLDYKVNRTLRRLAEGYDTVCIGHMRLLKKDDAISLLQAVNGHRDNIIPVARNSKTCWPKTAKHAKKQGISNAHLEGTIAKGA